MGVGKERNQEGFTGVWLAQLICWDEKVGHGNRLKNTPLYSSGVQGHPDTVHSTPRSRARKSHGDEENEGNQEVWHSKKGDPEFFTAAHELVTQTL